MGERLDESKYLDDFWYLETNLDKQKSHGFLALHKKGLFEVYFEKDSTGRHYEIECPKTGCYLEFNSILSRNDVEGKNLLIVERKIAEYWKDIDYNIGVFSEDKKTKLYETFKFVQKLDLVLAINKI